MSLYKFMTAAVICVATAASAASAQGKAKQPKASDVAELKAEVVRLRADLDAALREIAALKAAANGGKAAPDEGPLYRGRSAKSWLEQLKDLEPKTRIDALEALGVLAQKDKKLIPVLVDTAKNDKGHVDRVGYVKFAAVKALGAAGPDALPVLIEMVKDKGLCFTAVSAIRDIGPKAKSAVPLLAKVLEDDPRINMKWQAIYALNAIGPDAKQAIPALVKSLGACLEDIGKLEARGRLESRFGVLPDSMNVQVLEAIRRLDPALTAEVPLPKAHFGGRSTSTPEEQAEWRALHATLVKRYAKQK